MEKEHYESDCLIQGGCDRCRNDIKLSPLSSYCSIPVFQTPKAKADLCPVCKGSGKYTIMEYSNKYYTPQYYYTRTCHGCGGKGWVVIYE